MPIVFDTRTATDHFPGIGRYVSNLTRALASLIPVDGFKLLCAPVAVTRLMLPDVPQIVCGASPFSLRQQWQVPVLLRQAGAQLYHSPYYLMPYATGVPTIVTCHDLIPLLYPQYFRPEQRLLFWLAHKLVLTLSQAVLADSHVTKADLIGRFDLRPEKIFVTPLAADPHFAPRSPSEIDRVRRRYNLPTHYGLYLGSNKPHKNLIRLVEAWSQVSRHAARIPLVIAGPWDTRFPQAKERVTALGLENSTLFLGPIPEQDLPALYSGAEWFIFASLYEGFGLPVLEAMACGAPVACANASSLPEVTGDAALLFDPLDVDSIADGLTRLLEDSHLRASLRLRGLAQAQRFSWERAARETVEVYRAASQG